MRVGAFDPRTTLTIPMQTEAKRADSLIRPLP
jgi:hypothetical protein